MSEDLKKKLDEAKLGELTDEDLEKVSGGGDGKEDEKEEVVITYNYSVGQVFSQNAVTGESCDLLKIEKCEPEGDKPSYIVYVEIHRNGRTIKKGSIGVMENVIDDIAGKGTTGWTILAVADRIN